MGSADGAFAELERTFPKIRNDLISKKSENWKEHRDLLLRYVQMMRARSLLFFENMREEGRNLRAWIVKEVSPDRRSVTVESMMPQPLPEAFIRNRTITEMRGEIQQGVAWLNDFNWALRFCESAASPFIISEIPFIAHGRQSQLLDALRDPETLLFFPLCWQACLIGSRQPFDIETDRFADEDMRRIRRVYRQTANLFLLSPGQLEFN